MSGRLKGLSFLIALAIHCSAWAASSIEAPAYLDGVLLGEISGVPDDSSRSFSIESESFFAVIGPILVTSASDQIRRSIGSKPFITEPDLAPFNIKLKFNTTKVILDFEVPPELRQEEEISLRAYRSQDLRFQVDPVLSGFLNVRGSKNISRDTQGDSFSNPLTGTTETAFHSGQLTFIDIEDFQESRRDPFRRDQTRFVYDDNASLIRYQLGDLDYSSVGFQSSQSLGGFALSKNEGLQPNRLVKQTSQKELFIRRRSQVDIYINGVLFRSIYVNSGRLLLKDLPLPAGLNSVLLKIKDDTGAEETISLSFLSDSQALPRGYHDFSYQLGVLATPNDRASGLDYGSDGNAYGSFFHRYGVEDSWTVGVNFQKHQKKNELLGLENTYVNDFGLYSVDVAGQHETDATEAGVRAKYRSITDWTQRENPWGFSAGLEVYSSGFTPYGEDRQDYKGSVDLGVSRSLSPSVRLGVSSGYKPAKYHAEVPDQKSLSLDLSGNIATGWSASLNFSHNEGVFTENRVFATLNWVELTGLRSMSSSYEDENSQARIQVSQYGKSYLGRTQATAALGHNTDFQDATAQLDVRGSRLNLNLNHTYQSSTKNGNWSDSSNLGFGTALVFAGSNFGISRPVSEGFALFVAPSSLREHSIRINPDEDYSDTAVGRWGNGVLTDLRAYDVTSVNIDTSELPADVQIESERISVRPPYKGGVLVPLGLQSFITVKGFMFDQNNQPISMAAAEASFQGQPKRRLSFFTNANGRFYIEKAKPGKYLVEFIDIKSKPFYLTIPEDSEGTLQMDIKNVEVISE